jgi:hypothetical protein
MLSISIVPVTSFKPALQSGFGYAQPPMVEGKSQTLERSRTSMVDRKKESPMVERKKRKPDG